MSLGQGLLGRLKGEMALALGRTFLARGIAALGSLALVVVLGRLYGAAGVGVYALAHSLLMGAAILARFGMDNALMRYVGESPDSSHVMRYLYWACRRALVLSIVLALAIFFGRGVLVRTFGTVGLAEVLVGIAVATPAFTLGFLFSGFFKGIRKPATACLLENGSVALLAGGLVMVLHQYTQETRLAVIGWAYAGAAWLVLGQGIWQLWRWWRRQSWSARDENSPPSVGRHQFDASSRAFFVMSLARFMQAVLSIMVAGWLLSEAGLGLFKTSQQTGVLIGFILIVINAIFPPRFASLYREGNISALGRLARQGALLGIAIAAPLLLVCLLVPGWVLGLFGSEFPQAAPLLRIIALAQLVNVATGSVGFLLNMTGHETLMRNIALICNAIGLSMFFVLIPLFGPLGAAMALAFVLVVQNLVALYFVWRKLGIWTLPLPNVLSGLGISPEVDGASLASKESRY
ncbi:lipopolysaccharide biosynthesis protein [Halomonas koreensis]|uniref:Oligosaccharide flippase family protein n=1 Tax=Halomonas koreensis TaxID=245385 RepID=A0ABU1FZN2_9GAMM|nr:oligosaccharide flippase family protein [Halomonas koreensis]MDR5865936.1 oligosaccharide flippase family protein [Halomonas koreensis]